MESLNSSGKSALSSLKIMDIELDELGPAMEQTIALLEELDWY